MFVQKSQGQTVFAAKSFFLGNVAQASQHLPQQWSERHLFGFLAEIQCGIFSFQRGKLWLFSCDYEVTTTTDRRWIPHETKHCSLHTKAGNKGTQRQAHILLTQMYMCTKKPHRKITSLASLHLLLLLIKRENFRRPIIRDALVGIR